MYYCLFCKSTIKVTSNYENTIFNNKEFEYVKCKSCALVQLNPLPDESDFSAMYTMEYYHFKNLQACGQFDEYFKIIEKEGKYKTFLDYGCGGGRMIVESLEKEYDVFGVDYGHNLIDLLTKSYPKAKFMEVEDFHKSSEKFDIIFISNVFEHLINPKETFTQLVERLNTGGLIIVEGPAEDTWSFASYFRKSIFGIRKKLGKKLTHTPYHIFYSNYENQLAFFDHDKIKKLLYKVSENEWPFPARIRQISGFRTLIFYFIAKLSKAFALINPKQGSIFKYVGIKTT
jgi:2-polyprenyl-3-methyl-5-hydroxy-6-metoxy-1,4-benzoquinol methylase